MDAFEQILATLYGLALGDALGYPTEFLTLRQIKAKYGPQGIQEPPEFAMFSDDTQMTLALAEALIALQPSGASVDAFMAALGSAFVDWLHSPENNRAPGATCIKGVTRYEGGLAWREAGIEASKGCGSAMRVAPIGFFWQADEERLRAFAEASSLITHRHPTAIAATIGAAYLVKLALDGVHPDDYLKRIWEFTDGISEEFQDTLRRVAFVIGWGDEVAAMERIGRGWVAEEAVALALYCVMRYPDDYVQVVRRAANSEGDSDSVACIAGGISAARLGIAAIPEAWIARLEKQAYIEDVARRLAMVRANLGA